ncbi:hypothetical protein KHA80_07530 [Anaerobacillus sp. HL2]|nr:hypothetical protein KHA80_07530 [Anaerobacillus sp. HL2]
MQVEEITEVSGINADDNCRSEEKYMSTLNELLYYCKESNSFGALMFTGKWGCGKTYLIDKELSKELGQDYIIIRISSFGESSS